MSTVAPSLAELFKSLADPNRLRVLRALREAELSVGELAQVLGLAQSGVSRHLGVLKAAGLVQDRRDGTSSFYRLPDVGGDGPVTELWGVVRDRLDELPEAVEDARRVRRVLEGRAGGAAQAFFQDVAPRWDSIREAQYGESLRSAALLELLPRGLRVLDVGTGTGFMLLGLARHGCRLVGVDRSEAMLEEARRNLAAAGLTDVDLRAGVLEALPVETASQDVVTCNMALHHAAEPAAALREAARVLRRGGTLVLSDLARHDLSWTREEFADEWPGFAPEELDRLLADAGFVERRIRPVGTCRLSRTNPRESVDVPVLLATATAHVAASTTAHVAATATDHVANPEVRPATPPA